MTVTDNPKKCNMAAIIMQIRWLLTLRFIICIRDPQTFAVSKYELHSCLITKNENYGSPIP